MLNRRSMIANTALAAGGIAAGSLLSSGAFALPSIAPRRVFRGKLGKVQLLQVGVEGSIAPADRSHGHGEARSCPS
jgi:hypothetical protein